MRKIELKIVALTPSVAQSQNYAVVLEEVGGTRRLPIVIGGFEAQAIAVAMENMIPSRPLTHDLFKNTLETFDIQLKEVIINNLLDGIFYARLVCVKGGDLIEIDARTSDALALSVRFNSPIFAMEFVLDAAGVEIEDEFESEPSEGSENPKKTGGSSLDTLSLKELQDLLDDVLQNEDYERAAEIRDEINRRGES